MSQSRSTDDEDSEDTVTTAYLPTEVESTQLSGISVLTYSLTSVPDEPFNHAERQLERLLNQRNIIMNEYHEIRMNEGPVLTLFGVRITTGLDLLKSYSVLYWFFMCTRIIMRFDLYLFMALFGTVSTFFSSFSLASDYTYFLVPMVLALFLEVLIAVKQLYVILVLLPGLSLTSYESYSHLFGTLLSLDLINNDVR
ncbi:unnamed protein product [Bursaphelenchus okinawaensis]|uniref:Uncharacterized protein n=1 Tax=Bursaphelenchus okinawaensis TaxID=465554 RepID=A0A811LPR6_9BILA|nr:unnamed protein product [Bursaphelenchus okinawaensis]CAG9125701.1 unnamed protein product [Bursaphelenchus okinawaensis]